MSSVVPEVVEKGFQIFLHLDGVVLGLSNAEDSELAVFPRSVLLEQEWQEHEKATVMNDPPDIDVAADFVAWREGGSGEQNVMVIFSYKLGSTGG